MHSEPANESRADKRGRRRKRGNESADGPVFVDNSGRRSRTLRRIGLLLGVLSLGYAVVLGLAFMGIGVATTSLVPFGNGGPGGSSDSGPGGIRPQGGIGSPPALPTDAAPTVTPTATTSAAAH